VEPAAALAVRAVRLGSVCINLATVQGTASAGEAPVDAALEWPETSTWTAACSNSPMVGVDSDAAGRQRSAPIPAPSISTREALANHDHLLLC